MSKVLVNKTQSSEFKTFLRGLGGSKCSEGPGKIGRSRNIQKILKVWRVQKVRKWSGRKGFGRKGSGRGPEGVRKGFGRSGSSASCQVFLEGWKQSFFLILVTSLWQGPKFSDTLTLFQPGGADSAPTSQRLHQKIIWDYISVLYLL